MQLMCDILEVSRSGFYAWRQRPSSKRRERQKQLLERIQAAHQQSRSIYGSPRIFQQLKDQGIEVCENTVARLMKKQGICSKTRRRFVVHTTDSNHQHPIAANELEQDFSARRLNECWCADITYVPTDEGWLYLAAVIDVCSRRIVGWAMADHLKAELCIEALEMALKQRTVERGLMHHSDRGCQYACGQYQALLKKHSIACSMSRRGNCHDNALMESFFGKLKQELIHHQRYKTRQQATASIFEYIEVFHNRKRKHSSLGYLSPEAFEATFN